MLSCRLCTKDAWYFDLCIAHARADQKTRTAQRLLYSEQDTRIIESARIASLTLRLRKLLAR